MLSVPGRDSERGKKYSYSSNINPLGDDLSPEVWTTVREHNAGHDSLRNSVELVDCRLDCVDSIRAQLMSFGPHTALTLVDQ